MIHPTIGTKSATRHILRTFDIRASKRLGQNFLVDPNIISGIVEAAEITPGERVLEIGPGIGTLTQGLLEAGANVTAIEIDKKLPAVLAKTLAGYDGFRLVEGDVLKTDIAAVMDNAPFKTVANLPYYITTPILLELFRRELPVTRTVTMVQKEVAERMTASPGSKAYGSLSVAVQYYTRPRIMFAVPPKSFMPPPEVESAVVRCDTYHNEAVKKSDEEIFFRIVRAAFEQRRKTLANALKRTGFLPEKINAALDKAGIDAKRRGETLSIDEFAAIASAFEK